MLKELFDAIQESSVPTILEIDDPEAAHVFNPKTGEVSLFKIPEPRRNHVATTLDSFVDAVERYTRGVDDEFSQMALIWVGFGIRGGNATLIINDMEGHRNDKVTMPVAVSPLFETIARGASNKSQKELLKWLSHDVFSATIDPEGFQLAVSSLVWRIEDEEGANIGSVKSTMGRQITAEAKGERPVPSQIKMVFNPFPSIIGHEIDVSVRCTVITEPEEKRISVLPLPGEVDLALTDALNGLADFLRTKLKQPAPQVLCGTP